MRNRCGYDGIMKTADVIEHFGGTQASAAAALGLKQPSVASWGEYPPALRQIQIERITAGKLKAEDSCWNPTASRPVAA